MNESRYIYPYDDEYRDPRGCMQSLLVAAGVLLAGTLVVLMLAGCRAQQPISQTRDSVRVEVRRDSVTVICHDSVFRDRWREGDTVYVTTEKWRVQWRDRLQVVHDTVKYEVTKYEVQRELYRSGYTRFTSWFFWIVVVLVVLRLIWFIIKKFYLHV